MTNIKEIALFTSHGIGFYPNKLKPFTKTATEMQMRMEIFPDYIRSQEDMDEKVKSNQELYNNLKIGDGFRLGNRFYNTEKIPSRALTIGKESCPDIFMSTDVFKSMKAGETIEFEGKTYYKDLEGKRIFICESMTSTAELVEVDTSRPWTIEEYDGAEYIEYLDYDIVDEGYNYCKKKGR